MSFCDSKKISGLITLMSLALFLIIASARLLFPYTLVFETGMMAHIIALRSGLLTSIVIGFTEIMSPILIIALTIIVSLVLVVGRKNFVGLLYIYSFALGSALFVSCKILFDLARPLGGLIEAGGNGFPSGHATLASITFLFIVYACTHILHSKPRGTLFYFVIVCMIGAVGISRVYLGVHYPSDIVGGIALGTFSFFITLLFLRHYEQPRSKNS